MPDPTLSAPVWLAEDAPRAAMCDVRQGRRQGDTEWLVIRATDEGGEEVMRYASEAEARAAAETCVLADTEASATQARQGPVRMIELLLHKPKWWR